MACKRVLNLCNLEFSCPDPDLSNTDPDPKQEYGSVSIFELEVQKKQHHQRFFLNIVFASCVYPRFLFLQFVSKTDCVKRGVFRPY